MMEILVLGGVLVFALVFTVGLFVVHHKDNKMVVEHDIAIEREKTKQKKLELELAKLQQEDQQD